MKERATKAQAQFQEIVTKYPHTRSAEFARYFLGTTSEDLGDNAAAERDLKEVADSHNDDLAAMAKYALASVYRKTGQVKQAVDIYKELINKPTLSVGKQMAQMALADTYQAGNQVTEARNIYQQVQKESPASEAAQLAAQKLKDLK